MVDMGQALGYLLYLLIGALFLGLVSVFYMFYDQNRKPVSGRHALLGKLGRVKQNIPSGKLGKVYVFGEYWEALCDEDLEIDQAVKVLEVHDKFLKVAPSDKLPDAI